MKKWMIFLMLSCIGVLLAGCQREETITNGYNIYYINKDETGLVQELRSKQYDSVAEYVDGLLEAMANPSSGFEGKSAIPDNVKINGYNMADRTLNIDLSAGYMDLDNVRGALLRGAMVQTLIQISGVDNIRMTVEGTPLADSKGREIGLMNGSSFIGADGSGVNSYQYVSLSLYFASSSQETLRREMRNVYYPTNNTLEKVVVDELIKGPINASLKAILPPDTVLLNSSVKGSTCTLNFDGSFNKAVSGVPAELSIYAVVNAICDACNVTRVEFQINGESDVMYQDSISLAEGFRKNTEPVESVDGEETSETTDILEPAIGVVDPSKGTVPESAATEPAATEASTTETAETEAPATEPQATETTSEGVGETDTEITEEGTENQE